jgi:uncharacterized protein
MTRIPWVAAGLAAICVVATCSAAAVSGPAAEEEVTFDSRGARISATIVFPQEEAIVAGVVFVHGSGPVRRDLGLARRFADQGIAALVYDKRGVGRSGGEYDRPTAISGANLDLLAADAAAALDALRAHPRTRGMPVGLTGLSQAGWIVPLAAAANPETAFIGLWSGCVCRVSEEDIYSQYTSDRDFAARPAFDDVVALRSEPYVWSEAFGRDTDASVSLRELEIPGLWIFGADDGSVPPDLSISRLEELRRERPDRFGYILFSGLGHATIDATFDTMTDWIRRVATAAPPLRGGAGPAGHQLDRYLGRYVATEPNIEISITRRGDTLLATSRGETVELTHVSGDTYFGHEVGEGYFFIDFDAANGRMRGTQNGGTINLRRQQPSAAD